jgi:hypothetical protein
VALVGCVKRHIGKNIILLYQEHSSGNRIEPMPFEKLEQIVPRNVTKKAVPDRSKISIATGRGWMNSARALAVPSS